MTTNRNEQSGKPTRPSEAKGAVSRPPEKLADGCVLVVDDNPVIRQIVRRALEQAKFTVAEAENGARALTLLAHGRPGLIVLDLMMLGMDGFTFLTQLRQRPEWQAIPVVVLSAKPLTAESQAFVASHAQHFQSKGKSVAEDVVKLDRKSVV